MPYPTPNRTDIVLLHEVPLDSTYRNSIVFSTAGGQATYFLAHKKGSLEWTQCSYHRNEDELRVDAPIDQCMDVNYVMYKNDSYGAKWFYAFVTGCRFVNPNCTALKIELDVLQTWYFDYELLPCFIERCHTATDVIGENILPEPVEVGEPVILYVDDKNRTTFQQWDIIAYSTFDWTTWQPATHTGGISGGTFSGLTRQSIGRVQFNYPSSGDNPPSYQWITDPTTKLTDLITNHAALVDGVVAIVMAPTALENAITIQITASKPSGALGSYTPRNKKLYTKQFTRLMVTDGNGGGKYFNFEDFDIVNRCEFLVNTDYAPAQSIICSPINYEGSGSGNRNTQAAVIATGMPTCAWVSDAFQTYLAQNQASLSLTLATAGAQVIGGAALAVGTAGLGSAAGIGMAAGGLKSIIGVMADMQDRSSVPPKQHGNTTSTTMMALGQKLFKMIAYTCKPEYLERIDDFLDMFGYAYAKIGTVNINARPHWTYTKTNGAVAKPKTGSGCTAADLAKIQSIFDNGVTFWADGYEVGDYSLDNRV